MQPAPRFLFIGVRPRKRGLHPGRRFSTEWPTRVPPDQDSSKAPAGVGSQAKAIESGVCLEPSRPQNEEHFDRTAAALLWSEWLGALFPTTKGLSRAVGHRVSKLKRGEPSWPKPATVWWVARMARAAGYRWCAGPLGLFAAARFPAFVDVMTVADIPVDRKLELLRTVESAAAPSTGVPWSPRPRPPGLNRQMQALYKDMDTDDAAAAKFAARPDQKSWVLSPDEHAAFEKAFSVGGSASANPYIVMGAFIAKRYDFGIHLQRRLILENIEKAFGS